MNDIQIDTSWISYVVDLKSLSGVALAAGLVLAVGALVVGGLLLAVARLNGGTVRKGVGKYIAAALVGALVLGSLSAAVGWGTDHTITF